MKATHLGVYEQHKLKGLKTKIGHSWLDWKVGMDLEGVERRDKYDQNTMYEILKELMKLMG